MQGFDIYFLGEMLPDTDPNDVRNGVARLFKVEPTAAERLFSGRPLRVKKGVDPDTASRYRAAFRDVGALVQIVPEGDPPPAARPATDPTVFAPVQQRQQAPAAQDSGTNDIATAVGSDTSGDFNLAEPGATIDHTPEPPPAEFDTSAFEALPPNTGSLEDCRVEKPPRPIPDISHMKLVDD